MRVAARFILQSFHPRRRAHRHRRLLKMSQRQHVVVLESSGAHALVRSRQRRYPSPMRVHVLDAALIGNAESSRYIDHG